MIITALNSSSEFRTAARNLTKLAVREGVVKRKPCPCGSERSIAHHDDYSKPFCVRWLCEQCHSNRHHVLGWGYKGESNRGGRHQRICRQSMVRAKQLIFSPPAKSIRHFEIRSTASEIGLLPEESARLAAK